MRLHRTTALAGALCILVTWCAACGAEPAGDWGPQPEMRPPTRNKSPDRLPFRSWQLQSGDFERAKRVIIAAPDFGVNNIQLGHSLVMFASRLLRDEERIRRFNELIELAHSEGLTVHAWTHEFADLPEEITRERKWFDKPAVWELMRRRYGELFTRLPGLDGIVLTFHETPIMVFDVESDLPLAQRVAKLINHLDAACKDAKRTLVVRTFAYTKDQVEGVAEAFAAIDPEVILMSKCVPHDWEVFYPHEPSIGQYPDRKQVIEFDPGAEFYGLGLVPYLYPEYLRFRLHYARERAAWGYVARVERIDYPCAVRGVSPESGSNELNLYALKRLAEDPAIEADQIWREYIVGRVGDGAYVSPLIDALKLTDDVVNRLHFMLGCWYNNHSRLPDTQYADSHLPFIKQWNPQYAAVVARLEKPDARTVGEVYRESAEAIALAEKALDRLGESRRLRLPDRHGRYYEAQLRKLLATARKWAKHRNAYIREKSGGVAPSVEGPFPPGGPPRLGTPSE